MNKKTSFKKIAQTLFLLSLFFFSWLGAKGEDGSDTIPLEKALKEGQIDESAVVSRVGFNNAHIAEQNNHQIKVFFEMENPGKPEGNLLYGLQLEKKIDQDNYLAIEEKYYPERISLGQGDVISRQIEYNIPDFHSGDFRLWLVGKNTSGSPRGITYLGEIKLQGDNQYISIDNCFLQIGTEEKKYTLREGVSFKPDEVVNLTCDYTSHFDKPIVADLTYQLFRRSVLNGNGIDLASNSKETLSFQEKEEKTTATFALPKIEKPQAYDLLFQLKDQNQKVISNQVNIHLVLSGETMTISNLKLDKESYQKGEQAKVQLDWTGPADNFPDSRQMTKDQNFKVTVFAHLNDEKGEICAEDFQYSFNIDKDYDGEIFSIPIERDCPVVQGVFQVKNDQGEVLDTWQLNFRPKAGKTPTTIPEKKQITNRQKIVIGIFLLIIFSFVIALLVVWKKRKSNSSLPPISLFFFFVVLASLASSHSAHAGSKTLQIVTRATSIYPCSNATGGDAYGYKCKTWYNGWCTAWYTTESNCAVGGDYFCSDYNNYCYNNAYPGLSAEATFSTDKNTYSPGETITVSASGLKNVPCNNSITSVAEACFQGTCGEIYSSTTSGYTTFKAPSSAGNYTITVKLNYTHGQYQSRVEGTISFNVPDNPIGNFELADCTSLKGWAFDPSDPSSSIYVHLYDGSSYVGQYRANEYRDDVNREYRISGNHGFSITVPDSLKNNANHTLHVYAINTGRGNANPELTNSPRTIKCSPPSYSCSGTIPSGSTMCTGDDTGLTSNGMWHYVGTSSTNCSSTTKCEYYTPPAPVNGSCGPAATTYMSDATTFSGAFCNSGTVSPASPAFPAPDSSTTWTCLGQNGGSSVNCTATRQSCPTIGISLTANPATINQGYSSVISWSTSNVTSCGLYRQSDNYYLAGGTSGTATVSPSSTTTYRLGCANSCSSASQYTTVTVLNYSCQGSIPSNASAFDAEESTGLTNDTTYWTYEVSDTATKCQYTCNAGYGWNGSSCVPAPTLSFFADSYFIPYNTSTTLRWNVTNATSCWGSSSDGSWDGWKSSVSSSSSTGNLTSSKTYYLECWNSAGQTTGQRNFTISVPPPVNGSCGPAATTYMPDATTFSGAFCSSGTASPASPAFPAQGSSTTWTCQGQNGGSSVSCTANRLAVIPSACGTANGQVTCSKPETNLCGASNTASSVTQNGNNWVWTCTGFYSPPVNCKAEKKCPWYEVAP